LEAVDFHTLTLAEMLCLFPYPTLSEHLVKRGVESLDRGEGKPLDVSAIKAKGRARLAQRRK
jgi:hypothetical protein